MKKIAFLINSFGKGGAERVAMNVAEHFCKCGYEVLLVTSRTAPEEYEITFPAKRRVLEEERPVRDNRGGRIWGRLWQLRGIWRDERPGVIVSFIGRLNMYAILSSRGMGIPVFLSVRSDPAKEYPTRKQRMLAELLFSRAAGVIFQTRDALGFFSKAIQKKSVVLPNLLDPRFVKERFEGKRRDEIVMVGRLDANKNHRMLLEAFGDIHNRYPELKIMIYGGGLNDGSDTEPELRRLAGELGIAGKVVFGGRQTELYDKIDKARIFVLASGYEGMPNALLEAMALGLCVIATDCPCGGPAAVIKDGENGLLIPVGDREALKKALCKVLDDPKLEARLGRQACLLGKELMPDKVCAMWQKEIESRISLC